MLQEKACFGQYRCGFYSTSTDENEQLRRHTTLIQYLQVQQQQDEEEEATKKFVRPIITCLSSW
jgi:membrane-bound lytic murein transglycosylase MltF